ncbi:MAG: NAD(P)-dependent glycerol-3-phosphate dehydrogenase [Rhodocyclaceae bacterium]|nr:NAD(P)-dependent glycerol-3-phosphate dehydrogenase [Rhodocyclaceae bacterium]
MAVALSAHGALRLWCRDPAQAAAMQSCRENVRLLPGVTLPPAVSVSSDIAATVAGAPRVALAVPVNAVRETCQRLRDSGALGAGAAFYLLCKGFELATGELPHRVVEAELPGHPVFVLSGPSFAAEVGRGLPTAIALAGVDMDSARAQVESVHTARLRVYASNDRIGAEVGGAVKNVIAIAAGISDALGFGHNARAALVTRGLAEIARLGVALGGQAQTFYGLAGLGDLVLTTTSDLSRNRRLGLAVGRGESLEAAAAALGQVAEGVKTAQAVARLGREMGVELPITDAVCSVLFDGVPAQQAVAALLAREPRAEFGT